MELFPQEMREKLVDLHANEDLGLDALAQVKFFQPVTNWTWYASEFNGDNVFFGLVIGFVAEYGYFTLSELESMAGWIARDTDFVPHALNALKSHYDKEGWAL